LTRSGYDGAEGGSAFGTDQEHVIYLGRV
jgi:hypothetical protein